MSEYHLVPVDKKLDSEKIVMPKELIPNNSINVDSHNADDYPIRDFLSLPKKVTPIDRIMLRKYIPLLKRLLKMPVAKTKRFLHKSPAMCKIIKKICKLLVNGCIPLSRIQRKKLSPLAVKTLRDISSIKNAQLGIIINYPGLEKTLKVVLPIVARFVKNF